MTERVLILDFGSQYTQLIARRVREHRVYCEIHPCTVDDAVRHAASRRPRIILSGGPASTHEAASPRAPAAVFELGVPVLGVCYGEQTMCAQLGGRVEPSTEREYGRAEIRLDRPSPLFEGLLAPGQRSTVWMSHGDRITAIPPGFAVIAQSDTSPFAAIADEARRFYGVQFHPEVVHTAIGSGLLQNFLFRIAGLAGDWSMHAYRAQAIARIRAQVGDGRRDLRPLRRRRFRRHRPAPPRGRRRPAHLRLRRHRPAALRRGQGGGRPVPRPLQHPADPRRRRPAVPGASSPASADPEAKRKTIGATFIDVFDAEAAQARRTSASSPRAPSTPT